MSLCNVWVDSDFALVAVDSEGQYQDGIFNACKLIVLPHLPGIVAGVGVNLFLHELFDYCTRFRSHLDDLVDHMPAAVRQAYAAMLKTTEQHKIQVPPDHAKQSAVLCGWSETHHRIVARLFVVDGEKGVSAQDIPEGGYLAQPMPDEWRKDFAGVANPDSPERMAVFAGKQASMTRERLPDVHIGGRLIVAEIRREGMTVKPAYDFGRLAR
jgi:hypothetical protein